MKYTQGGVLLLVKLQALARNFTKSSTPVWVFSGFLNLTNGTISRNAPQTYMEDFNNEIQTRI